jgi:hypothetical protein
MRDRVWHKPIVMDTKAHGKRTVYVRHIVAPFASAMVDADTAFTVPAFIRIRGKKITGFVTPRDGMAFQQDCEAPWFVAHTQQKD